MKLTFIILIACMVAVPGCKKAEIAQCTTKLHDIKIKNKEIGASFLIKCPAACKNESVWGSDVYTVDSALCAAAIHAGAISDEKGGMARVTIVKSIPKYQGSEKNGVTTRDWPSPWGNTALTFSAK